MGGGATTRSEWSHRENSKEDKTPRRVLTKQNNLRRRGLRIVRKQRMCDLDELILECTSYSWTDVFLEVDQLSRSGELRLLSQKGR
jgi:hypothetical protein